MPTAPVPPAPPAPHPKLLYLYKQGSIKQPGTLGYQDYTLASASNQTFYYHNIPRLGEEY
ncbi:MAG: hypothetical protein ACOVNU_04450 [Candidatus Kapaibacteriota bacterium]